MGGYTSFLEKIPFISNLLIKTTPEEIQFAKSQISSKNSTVWDPTLPVNFDTIRENCAKIKAKYIKLQNEPNKIKKQFLVSYCIMGIGIILGLLILFTQNSFESGVFLIFFLSAPLFILNSSYKSLSIDIIKLQIAEQKSWVYDPNSDMGKWNHLKNHFPELFSEGDENQYVEDQFWGTTKVGNKTFYFNSGLFSYDVVTRDSKGRRHRSTYKKHYISLYTPKELKCRFHLHPDTAFSKIGNFFTKKEINTESNEFNNTFAFSYKGPKGENAQEIVKTLSPAVQDKLVQLAQRKNGVEILFNKNAITFRFDGVFFNTLHTNLKESLDINSKDLKFFESEISDLASISSEVVQYLD
jgi:hypothetical protein